MGTAVNIELLLRELRGSSKRDARCCLFVDFKSAYNTVRRDRLYAELLDRGILRAEEIKFLRCLHNALYFPLEREGKRVYLRDGVHQGSPLSPALFDVYMQAFTTALSLCIGTG
jgi:hypothetical protein